MCQWFIWYVEKVRGTKISHQNSKPGKSPKQEKCVILEMDKATCCGYILLQLCYIVPVCARISVLWLCKLTGVSMFWLIGRRMLQYEQPAGWFLIAQFLAKNWIPTTSVLSFCSFFCFKGQGYSGMRVLDFTDLYKLSKNAQLLRGNALREMKLKLPRKLSDCSVKQLFWRPYETYG